MIRIRLAAGGQVRLAYAADLPMPRTRAWATLRRFERIACLDHFHREVRLAAPRPAAGVEFELPHGACGIRIARRGRILRWSEGRGYAFSDLSAKDAQRSFPHVFTVALDERSDGGSRLRLEVAGRWTARWLPRPLVRLWLAWNLLAIGVAVEAALLEGALSSPENGRGPDPPDRGDRGLGGSFRWRWVTPSEGPRPNGAWPRGGSRYGDATSTKP